jgi:hypothetical protein
MDPRDHKAYSGHNDNHSLPRADISKAFPDISGKGYNWRDGEKANVQALRDNLNYQPENQEANYRRPVTVGDDFIP